MFSMLKKTARFFGKGIGYCGIFCISPFLLVGMCCSDSNGRGTGSSLLKCLGCLFIPIAFVLIAFTLPLGLAGMAISLAGLITICPLAAVGDCFAAAFRACAASRRAAPARAVHHHPAYDIENPPPAPIRAEPASSHANIMRNSNIAENKPLDAFSKYTQDYVDSFASKKSHSAMISEMKLTESEQKLLEKFCDPITGEIMDIPVILNERVYNLLTLQTILTGDKKDPFNRMEFSLRDIQSARSVEEEIRSILKQIEENRKKAANKPAEKASQQEMRSSTDSQLAPKLA